MPEKQKGIFNTLRNLYASVDGYASGPSLTVNKESNSKSVIGSTLTILTILLTFYLSGETIMNVLKVENPKVTYDTEQGTENITDLNFSNFFMAYSFFTPKDKNIKFSNETNNWNVTSTMTTFLGDCIHDCNNFTFLMGHCNKTYFEDLTLKGLPLKSSKNISEIFKEYSFCLPKQFKATLLDDDITLSDFVSSFSIYIPDTYNQTQTGIVGNRTYRVLTNIPPPNGNNVSPSGNLASNLKTTSSVTPSFPTGSNSNPTSNPMTGASPGNFPSPATPNNNKNQDTSSSTSPPQTNGLLGASCPLCQSYETCSNGKCVTQNQQQAIVATVKTFNSYDNPSSANYAEAITVGTLAKAIKEKIEANMYPRLFMLTQNIEVLPRQSKIVQLVHNFNNLDFRDKITGLPYQYDVFVKRVLVKTIKPKNLFIDTSGDDDFDTYYTVSDIVINTVLGNDPTKAGVTLYFKVDGTTQVVYITYNNFNDILSDLGSYFSIFDLVARLISMFYADYFLQADLLNSVFSFNELDVKLRKGKKRRYSDESEGSSDGKEDIPNNDAKYSSKDNIIDIKSIVTNKRDSDEKLNRRDKDNYNNKSEKNYKNPFPIASNYINNYIDSKVKISLPDNYQNSKIEIVEVLPVGMGKDYNENELSAYSHSSNIKYNDMDDINSSRPIEKNGDYNKKQSNNLVLLSNKNENLNITNPSVKNSESNNQNQNNSLIKNNLKINSLIKQIIEKEEKEEAEETNLPEGIMKKYKLLLNSLSFNENNKLESNITNKFEVSPYDLMFECCYKKLNQRNHAKYELYKKCQSILEKTMNIEYIIKKDMEVNFIREYLLSQTENNMFKYHFKSLNVLNFDDSMTHLKRIKSEGVDTLTKDELINEAINGNHILFEVFYDYHAS